MIDKNGFFDKRSIKNLPLYVKKNKADGAFSDQRSARSLFLMPYYDIWCKIQVIILVKNANIWYIFNLFGNS